MIHLRNEHQQRVLQQQQQQEQVEDAIEEVLRWCEQTVGSSTCGGGEMEVDEDEENSSGTAGDGLDEGVNGTEVVMHTESGTDSAMRSVLNNDSLSEEEKCFLYLAIAERGLYKKGLACEQAQFTFEVREDPSDPKKLHCAVERVNVKDKKRRKTRRGPGRVQSAVFAIVGPIVGAVFAVILRSCFCKEIPLVQ
jgi:hypothetical protein